VDVREHQSWATPPAEEGVSLLSLYQRQCLSIDRDALPGLHREVWGGLLEGGDLVAMLFNKANESAALLLSSDMLQTLTSSDQQKYRVRDLWAHADLKQLLTSKVGVVMPVPAHGVALLRLTPV